MDESSKFRVLPGALTTVRRERERERDRQTETDRQRQTDRQTETERRGERERKGEQKTQKRKEGERNWERKMGEGRETSERQRTAIIDIKTVNTARPLSKHRPHQRNFRMAQISQRRFLCYNTLSLSGRPRVVTCLCLKL